MISFIVALTSVSIFPLQKNVKSENRLPKYINVLLLFYIYIYIYFNKVWLQTWL